MKCYTVDAAVPGRVQEGITVQEATIPSALSPDGWKDVKGIVVGSFGRRPNRGHVVRLDERVNVPWPSVLHQCSLVKVTTKVTVVRPEQLADPHKDHALVLIRGVMEFHNAQKEEVWCPNSNSYIMSTCPICGSFVGCTTHPETKFKRFKSIWTLKGFHEWTSPGYKQGDRGVEQLVSLAPGNIVHCSLPDEREAMLHWDGNKLQLAHAKTRQEKEAERIRQARINRLIEVSTDPERVDKFVARLRAGLAK